MNTKGTPKKRLGCVIPIKSVPLILIAFRIYAIIVFKIFNVKKLENYSISHHIPGI